MDLFTIGDSYKFFYGTSVIYLVIACYFILNRIIYNERSNRTSYSYVVLRVCHFSKIEALFFLIYSILNVVGYDFNLVPWRYFVYIVLSCTFVICFFNGITPFVMFVIIRRQMHNISIFKGMLNRFALLVFSCFVISFTILVPLILLQLDSVALDTYDYLFRLTVFLAFLQMVLFFFAYRDSALFIRSLLKRSFFTGFSCTVISTIFIYLPTVIWPLNLALILPLSFIIQVAYIFVVHILSQAKAVSRDFLTGMNNRNELYRYLTHMFEKGDDLNSTLHLIFIDVNKFKSINDTYGHSQGDKALIALSDALKKSAFSRNCFLSRYAGDEFVVVMRETPEQSVENFISNLLENIRMTNESSVNPFTLSVSIGEVAYSDDYTNLEEFIEAADRDMYEHKSVSEF